MPGMTLWISCCPSKWEMIKATMLGMSHRFIDDVNGLGDHPKPVIMFSACSSCQKRLRLLQY